MSEEKKTENSESVDTGRKSFSRSLSNSGRAYSDSDGGSFEFDIALAFSESDVEKAERVLEELQQLVLQDGTRARVCLYNDEKFGGSIIESPSRLLESCRFVFVLMTNYTTEDDTLRFFKNEVLGKILQYTRSEDQRVRVLHTEPKSCRKYMIPDGLNDPRPLDWHEPMDTAKSAMVKLLSVNRKIRSGGLTSNGKSKEKKEMTPQARKIRDDSNCVLKKWQRELYCPTLATHASMETLKRRGSLLISGRSGDGKTATAYHILTELRKISPTFQPFIIHTPEDLDHIQFENSIIFIDNIFGVSHFSSILLEQWKIRFQTLEAYVDKGSLYFLATSSLHVIASCTQQINNINLLSPKVDMAEEYRLNSDEKQEMLTQFIKWKGLFMASSEIERAINSQLTLGFPQCCKLYVSNTKAQKLGAEFFEKPFIFLNDQISKFDTSEIETDRVSYQVLLLCVFQKGQFSSESLKSPTDSVPISSISSSSSSSSSSCSSSSSWSILNEVCSVTNCSSEIRRQAAKNLVKMGLLIYMEQTGFYEFSHQSIYDAVCISLGKKDYVKDVLELAPAAFLVNNTSISDESSEREENIIFVSQVHRPFLIDRIITELKKGNIKILEHSMFCQTKVVEELFKRTDFADALTNMLKDHQQVFVIWHLNFLYFLSASQKYQTLVLTIIDILKTIPKDSSQIPMEFLISENVWLNLGSSQFPTSFNEVHKALVHQCFEGACYSCDLRIIHHLKKLIKPCNNCFLKTIESHVDHPDILPELLSLTSEFHIERTRLVSDLVRREKLKSLESVLKPLSFSTDTVKRAALVLLKEACMSGNFKTFDKLKNRFGFPDDRHYELLFSAVRGEDIRILRKLITDKNKNCLDEKGRTLLHLACEKEQAKTEELVDFLIAHGITTTILDKKGRSALHLVCKYKDLELLKKIIYKGVEVTVTNTEKLKVSPLHMAAQNEKGSFMVDILIEKSPKDIDVLNFQDGRGQTPLHIAAQKATGFEMIEKLLAKKANHTIRDEKGQTALHKAAEFNLMHIMRALINHDDNLVKLADSEKKTPLHLLLSKYKRKDDRKSQTVELLLQAGTDVHLADKDGNTVLHIAVESQAGIQVLQQLLGKFTRDIGCNKKGLSPLHCLLGKSTCQKSIDLLMAKFPSLLETPTTDGRSVLHVALQNRSPYQIIDYILKKPSVALEDVKWQDLDVEVILCHFSPEELIQFIYFCAYYFPLCVKFAIWKFICKSQVFDIKHFREVCDLFYVQIESGRQTLMFDVLGHLDRIEYLVKKGASVNVENTEGITPLHASVHLPNNINTFEILITAGADVNKADKTGSIPLHYVMKINFILAFITSMSGHPCYISVMELLFHKDTSLVKEKDVQHNIFQPSKAIWSRILKRFEPMDFEKIILYAHFHADAECLVSLLLNKNSKVNTQDNKGLTPLHYSVYDDDIFAQLVAAEGDVKLTTQDGWSCLHMACLLKNRNAVRCLLENGVSPFARDINGISPFQVALISGADDDLILQMLSISEKYQPHEHDLHLAASYHSKVVIEKIIDPMMLFAKNSNGHLPIFCAVANGKLDVVEMLLQAMRQRRMKNDQTIELKEKSEPLSAGDTDRQKIPKLKALLETNGNLNTQTLLHIACKYNCPQLVQLLVNEGFHVNSCDEQKQTPLHVSVMSYNSNNVEYLLSERAEVNSMDNEGLTPLMYSCMTDCPSYKIIFGLIHNGASVKARSNTKRTALHYLVGNHSLFLPQVNYMCSDPLTVAALNVFKLLIEREAEVNAKDQHGQTPLHLAAAADNTWFVSILLDHGADIDALDSQGIRPLQCALGESPLKLSPWSLTAQYIVDRGACLEHLDHSALSKLKTAGKTTPGNPERLWKERK